MVALLLGIIFSIGAAVSIYMSHGSVSAQGFKSVLNGTVSSQYESEFDDNLFHYKPSKGGWDLSSYALFKEGRDGVIIGKDNWLFTSEEFDNPSGYENNIKQNQQYILSAAEEIQRNGSSLFIVPIPSKARMLSDKLERYNIPDYRKRVYSNFIGFLDAQKIAHIDLAFNIQNAEEFFLKTDTHWSPNGANLAAQLSADQIKRDISLNWDALTKEFETQKHKPKEYEGDLMRYTVNGLAADIASFDVDSIQIAQTVSSGLDDDLFGNQEIHVALIGTSYSANKEWNFDGFLKQSLSADVLNMADEGLGPFETMQSYLKSSVFRETPPKLIIWEIPERFLPVNYDLTLNKDKNV